MPAAATVPRNAWMHWCRCAGRVMLVGREVNRNIIVRTRIYIASTPTRVMLVGCVQSVIHQIVNATLHACFSVQQMSMAVDYE
jgi:hypothetical protein